MVILMPHDPIIMIMPVLTISHECADKFRSISQK